MGSLNYRNHQLEQLTFLRDCLPSSRAIITMHHMAIALPLAIPLAIFLVAAPFANGGPMPMEEKRDTLERTPDYLNEGEAGNVTYVPLKKQIRNMVDRGFGIEYRRMMDRTLDRIPWLCWCCTDEEKWGPNHQPHVMYGGYGK